MEDIFSIIQFLRQAVKTGASDEHLMVGHAPYLRINGFIKKVTSQPLTKEDIDNAILDIAPTSIRDKILTLCDVDFMYEIKGCSRFRINYNRQLGMPGLVIRNIPYEIPKLKELSLPDILGTLIEQHNGIILVTGPTGCGKSTTIASLINYINETKARHVITIEDPVEYTNEFLMKEGERSGGSLGAGVSQFRSLGLLHPGVLDSLCLIGNDCFLSIGKTQDAQKQTGEKISNIQSHECRFHKYDRI